MIDKMYIEKGVKTKRVRGRGLTFARIILHHNKNFRGAHPKWKIKEGHYFALAESAHYKGEMKWRHATLTLISHHTE
jgi:hypothetical protein